VAAQKSTASTKENAFENASQKNKRI